MKIKRNMSITNNAKFAIGIALGAFCAFAISLLLVACVSGLIVSGKIGADLNKAIIFAARVISMFAGVLQATGWIREKSLVVSVITMLFYLLVLIFICMIAFECAFVDFWLCVLSVIIGGGAGLLVRTKSQSGSHRRSKIRK